jgi:hypothetical protein
MGGPVITELDAFVPHESVRFLALMLLVIL